MLAKRINETISEGKAMSDCIMETKELTVFYGRYRGIVDLNLQVQPGEVFGFLGPNGAGKTTTLRVLLDVIRPKRGRATIFGLDCQKDGVAIRQRVGYLSGELSLPEGLTGQGYLDTMAGIRGHRDRRYQEELCTRLNLDPSRRLREYSRGNKQKVGLVAAFMHKPDLLILDEPTSGLDPLVQQTVLDLVRETRQEGRTVFLSSHILPEVQAVCDRVGIIREGRLVAVERVDTLIGQQLRRLRLVLRTTPPVEAFALEGVREVARHEQTVTLEIRQSMQAVMETAVSYGIVDIEAEPVTLEEIFLAYYGKANHQNGGQHV